jgi:mannose-6-phosphate isomerase-like protein (cupin superfamily)
VDLFSDAFPPRFAAYCGAVARFLAAEMPAPRFYTPVNEISFLSFAAGEAAIFRPFARGRGDDIKRQLVRAALSAVAAFRAADKEARFVHVDPLVRWVPPDGAPADTVAAVGRANESVFDAFRMLAGRKDPDLGGSPEALDIAGVNIYEHYQRVFGKEGSGSWVRRDDPRWMPLRVLLRQVWERVDRPLIVGETGDNGPRRPGWLRHLLREVEAARGAGVPVLAVCWYPAVSSPDWYDPTAIFSAGLWDVTPGADGRTLDRIPSEPVLRVIRSARPGRVGAAPPEPRAPVGPLDGGAVENGVARLRRRNALACHEMPDGYGRELLMAGEKTAVTAYALRAGQGVSIHTYLDAETVLCVLEGEAFVSDWETDLRLKRGETLVVPAGQPFGLDNAGDGTCRILQVCTPRPWSADAQGPIPADFLLSDAATSATHAAEEALHGRGRHCRPDHNG